MKKFFTVVTTGNSDDHELNVTMRAMDLWAAVHEFMEELRSRCKHGDGDVDQLEEVRELLWRELTDRGINGLFY